MIQTSRGSAVVDLDQTHRVGVVVRVIGFDSEGWGDEGKSWFANHSRETLGQYLANKLSLPANEAETLASDVLGPWLAEWERRGGKRNAREVARWTTWFLAGVVLLLALAIIGTAALVWVLVT